MEPVVMFIGDGSHVLGKEIQIGMQQMNLTLCVPSIILQCVTDQRDAQLL